MFTSIVIICEIEEKIAEAFLEISSLSWIKKILNYIICSMGHRIVPPDLHFSPKQRDWKNFELISFCVSVKE